MFSSSDRDYAGIWNEDAVCVKQEIAGVEKGGTREVPPLGILRKC
jgi:hypothetical protein